MSSASNHKTITRPWCEQVVFETADNFQVKRITVKGETRSSYQTHEKRDEYWVVVDGVCKFIVDGEEKICKSGEAASAKRGTKHRFGSADGNPVVLIEIQTGEYFGEDDIVRYEDDFGRV